MHEETNTEQDTGDTVDINAALDIPEGTIDGHPFRDVMRRLRDSEEKMRRVEAGLRWSEEHLRMVVNGARDYAIFMIDPDGGVLTWNEGAERMKLWMADESSGNISGFCIAPKIGKPVDRSTI